MTIDQVLIVLAFANLSCIICAKGLSKVFLKTYKSSKERAENRLIERSQLHLFPVLTYQKMIRIIRLSGFIGLAGTALMHWFVQFVDGS